jgi:hypothetical protein
MQIWPWIEEWELRFEARTRCQQWVQGGLADNDLASVSFLKLMRRLHIVLLQDLAVLPPWLPLLPFFFYAPLYSSEWEDFALTVQAGITDTVEPPSLLLQRALPELYGLIESTRSAILHTS